MVAQDSIGSVAQESWHDVTEEEQVQLENASEDEDDKDESEMNIDQVELDTGGKVRPCQMGLLSTLLNNK